MGVSLQIILNTIQIGSVYALFSLGFSLTFGVMRLVNFAHGEFFAMAALCSSAFVTLIALPQLPIWAVFILSGTVSIACVVVLSYIVYKICFERFLHDMGTGFIISLGLVLIMQSALFEIFGGFPLSMPPLVRGNLTILGATTTNQRALVTIAAVLITIGLYFFLMKSRIGLALRAAAEDHEAAMLQAIPYRQIATIGFVIGAALAAVAGVLIAPTIVVVPTIGASFLIKGFMIAVVGGLGSIRGALIASLLFALVESIGGFFWDLSMASVLTFALVIALLSIRPRGLFGHA